MKPAHRRFEEPVQCERHWVELMSIGALDCPVCHAERWFDPHEIGDAAHPDFIHEQRKAFTGWLIDTLSNEDEAGVELIWLWIEDEPWKLIDRWRWETQPVVGRRSVRVSECSWCGKLIGVQEHYGIDANKGEAVYISHGKCDACLEKQAKQEVA